MCKFGECCEGLLIILNINYEFDFVSQGLRLRALHEFKWSSASVVISSSRSSAFVAAKRSCAIWYIFPSKDEVVWLVSFDDGFLPQNDAEKFAEQSVMEIKNGRIAMLAFLGYAVQAAVTRKGPLENLLDFVADPAQNNIFAYI